MLKKIDVSASKPASDAEPPDQEPSRLSSHIWQGLWGHSSGDPKSTPLTSTKNQQISGVFGLPNVTSSEKFRKTYIEFEGRDVLRKTDGKKNGEDSEFSFPVQTEEALAAVQEGQGVAGEPFAAGVEGRCEASYVEQIAELQARLRIATSQLEQANVVSVGQAEELKDLKCEKKKTLGKVQNLKSENLVLKRRINMGRVQV